MYDNVENFNLRTCGKNLVYGCIVMIMLDILRFVCNSLLKTRLGAYYLSRDVLLDVRFYLRLRH